MFEREKLSHIVAVAFLLIAVSAIAVAEYFGVPVHKTFKDRHVFCTQEAKMCPDGSAVGRTGPNCEFAECVKSDIVQVDTSTWKTCRNEKYGYVFKYPTEWNLYRMKDGGESVITDSCEDLLVRIGDGNPDREAPAITIRVDTPQEYTGDIHEDIERIKQYISKGRNHVIVAGEKFIDDRNIGSPLIGYNVYGIHNDAIVSFNFDIPKEVGDTFLSTFKFIE